jgi:hypothetical protein
MIKDVTYSKIETAHEIPGSASSKLEWERQPVIIRFAPVLGGRALQASVSRHLQKQNGEMESVPHTFLCFKRDGSWSCQSYGHSVKGSEWFLSPRKAHSRNPQKSIRREWYATTEQNCMAIERKMVKTSDAQKQILYSDADKLNVTMACDFSTGAETAFWYSCGWLVSEFRTADGQLWICPVSKFDTLEAAKSHVELILAPRPPSYLSFFEDGAETGGEPEGTARH